MNVRRSLFPMVFALAGVSVMGQTRIDLSGQTKGVLPELEVARSSNTVLTIGAACSLEKPCAARMAGTTFRYSASATVTVLSGTPTVLIYISDGSDGAPAGTLKVRNSTASGVSCGDGCSVENGESTFPGMSIPLAMWTAGTSGQWSPTGLDLRAFLSSQPAPVAGPGIVITQGVPSSVAVDAGLIPRKFIGSAAPATIAASTRGDLYVDSLNGDSYQCFSATSCSGVGPQDWIKLSTGPQPYLGGPWFFYGRASTVSGMNPSLGTGGAVLLGKVDTPARQLRRMAFAVTTPAINTCGSGTNSCGLTIAVLDATRSTILCQTEQATGGNPTTSKDLNTSGVKAVAFATGTMVTGGTCTLPFGDYWWAIGTDSVQLEIAADEHLQSGDLLGSAAPADVMLGTVASALTGTGVNLGFADLQGTLTPASVRLPVLVGIF